MYLGAALAGAAIALAADRMMPVDRRPPDPRERRMRFFNQLKLTPAQRDSATVIYDDNNKGTRLRPAFGLGAGTTIAAGKGYQIRWEIRDNIVGIQRVTGVSPGRGQVPPHETAYKHLFSLNVGLDVILERKRGRRY